MSDTMREPSDARVEAGADALDDFLVLYKVADLGSQRLKEAARAVLAAADAVSAEQAAPSEQMLNGLTEAETTRSASVAGLQAAPSGEAEYLRGWNACMAVWADHMKRMNEAISKPLRDGWANHAAELGERLLSLRDSMPATHPAPAPAAVPAGWSEVYAAFLGAFDTPLARRLDDSEFALDARRRMRDFNDAMLSAAPPPPNQQSGAAPAKEEK